MPNHDMPTLGLSGSYRDVLHDGAGRLTWDSGWKKNQIVLDCRKLLSAFARGDGSARGIQGLWLGTGDPAWDSGLPPPPQPTDTNLVSRLVEVLVSDPAQLIKFTYLDPDTGAVSIPPTQRLQIVATLGPGVATGTLREFGLVGQVGGKEVFINQVRHVAIVKDPVSTLVRTIQLVF